MPDDSIRLLISQQTFISNATADEMARLIAPGGRIFLDGENNVYNRERHGSVAVRIPGATVSRSTVIDQLGRRTMRTIITAPVMNAPANANEGL